MKKILFFLSFFLFGSLLFAQQEPLIKFYLNNDSVKTINLDEIDNINIIKSQSNNVMKIFYRDSLTAYYPSQIIDNIKFEKDSLNKKILNVYISIYPKTYYLNEIDSILFAIDEYLPLTIGTQVWMLKNLDVDHYRNGEPIPQVTDNNKWINLTTGAWCWYNNDSAIVSEFGKLYNWFAVNDSRGLAPDGWHIPSLNDWKTLYIYLGGEYIAGGKLKLTGTTYWISPNTGATNESGFSALPGGSRSGISGEFVAIEEYSFWWNSNEKNDTNSWYSFLTTTYASLSRVWSQKTYGYSVRCIKD
ncbi:MAG: fibrobacter succinogenes major paralogous domain-containing protein [Bacteroidota bacterium]